MHVCVWCVCVMRRALAGHWQQESEQRAVALLSRNTVLEEELENYKVRPLPHLTLPTDRSPRVVTPTRRALWSPCADVLEGASQKVPKGNEQAQEGARKVQEAGKVTR